MKWLFFSFLFVAFGNCLLGYLFTKSKKNLKVFLSGSFFTLIIFIGSMCYICFRDYQSNIPILMENSTLLYEKNKKEEDVTKLKNEEKVLEETIASLNNRLNELNEYGSGLTKEIEDLKKTYNTLYIKYENIPLFQVENFPTFDQRSEYPNGCESIALYLLLKYHGVDVTPDNIISSLKKGDSVHIENGVKYGGDPEIEFIGNPKSKSGYGVFEGPIIDVANKYKSGIIRATGKSLDEILKIVKSGKPVQVWASSYGRTPTKCNTWVHKASGKTITWYCHFHSLVLIGATSSKVIVSDSLTGSIVKYDKKVFETAYNFYGKRAIYYE